VTATSATARDGPTVRFLTNWSFEPATVTLPVAVRDVVSGAALQAGTVLELTSSDVRVLVEV